MFKNMKTNGFYFHGSFGNREKNPVYPVDPVKKNI
jgi:hypothetical protein